MWHDLTAIAESVNFTDDCDSIIWAFDGSSKFSVQAIYKTISFGGIQPVFTPSIWSIVVPPGFISSFGSFQTTRFSLEITWPRGGMLRTTPVYFALNRSRSVTCFLTAWWQKLAGRIWWIFFMSIWVVTLNLQPVGGLAIIDIKL